MFPVVTSCETCYEQAPNFQMPPQHVLENRLLWTSHRDGSAAHRFSFRSCIVLMTTAFCSDHLKADLCYYEHQEPTGLPILWHGWLDGRSVFAFRLFKVADARSRHRVSARGWRPRLALFVYLNYLFACRHGVNESLMTEDWSKLQIIQLSIYNIY